MVSSWGIRLERRFSQCFPTDVELEYTYILILSSHLPMIVGEGKRFFVHIFWSDTLILKPEILRPSKPIVYKPSKRKVPNLKIILPFFAFRLETGAAL